MSQPRPQARAGAKRRRPCEACAVGEAALVRPKTGKKICKACFYREFEDEIHQTVVANDLFQRGERVAIAASGGKDSTVLAHTMTLLNERHDYGLDLFLLSVDEGITGYRDDSLETVKRNQQQYSVPLVVVSYKDLYGWTMDDIVAAIGLNSNCTFCGVFRRQALDRGAALCHADKVVTGHNADDVAETVLMNILRGDIARLGRCTSIVTGAGGFMPRSKPFKYVYEKEIVMYAYFNKLDYFSTECIYSPNAYRGYAREFLKDLEAVRATSILDIIHAAEHMAVRTDPDATVSKQTFHACAKCGYMSSQPVCQACVLLNGLNTGKAKLALNDSSARSRLLQQVAQEAQAKTARGAAGPTVAATSCACAQGGVAGDSTSGCGDSGTAGGGGGCCESAPGAAGQCCSVPASDADASSKRVAVLIRREGHTQDVRLRSTAQWDAMDGADVLAPEEGTAAAGEGAHSRPIMAGVSSSVHDW